MLVFSVARVDAQRGNAPDILLFRVELDVVVVPRQALALRHQAEVSGNFFAHLAAKIAPEAGNAEGMTVK